MTQAARSCKQNIAEGSAAAGTSLETQLKLTNVARATLDELIVLIQQTRYLLDRMLKWQEDDFKKHGGVRERMHAARTEARAETWDKGVYSMLDLATDSADLARRVAEIERAVRRTAAGIARRKGWSR